MPLVTGPSTPGPGVFPTEQEHFDAIKAFLTTHNAVPRDYDANIATDCNLLTISDRFGGAPRLSTQIGTRSVRITLLAVGEFPDNAREMRRRHDTLRGQRLTIAGRTSTPIQFESADPVGQDGDILTAGTWYTALSRYTYTV